MTPLLFLLVAVAGGMGAGVRLLVDGLIRSRLSSGFPFGTTIINLTGSVLLGFVTGLALSHLLEPHWQAVLGTGFLGGYTTFSTASFETVRLVQAHRYRAALANGIGTLLLGWGAAGLGLWLGWAA